MPTSMVPAELSSGTRTRRSGALWIGLGLAWALVACGAAKEPTALGGSAGSAGVGGSSGAGTGGSSGTSDTAGAGGSQTSSDAGASGNVAACPLGDVPFFHVEVRGAPLGDGPRSVRLMARGLGSPPGVSEPPLGVASTDLLGWLQVASEDGDAGTTDLADSGAGDAGGSQEWVILGPSSLRDVAAGIGERLVLRVESAGFDGLARAFRVVLRKGESVLLFHQDTERSSDMFGTFSDIRLARGNPACQTPVLSVGAHCADIVRYQLLVNLPGFTNPVALAPGAEDAVGTYRLFHGSTSSVELVDPEDPSCAGASWSQITVIHSSFEE